MISAGAKSLMLLLFLVLYLKAVKRVGVSVRLPKPDSNLRPFG